MKEFLKDIFPRIIKYSKQLDDQSILTDKPWLLFSDDSDIRELWIFKRNHELIVSRDGFAEKGSWEYIPEAKSLYIEIGNVRRLINQAFVDDVVLLLRLDGGKEFITLANEKKIDEVFKIERYLDDKYQKIQIESDTPNHIPEPSAAIPPEPPTLEEQITNQKNELFRDKIILSLFLCLGLFFMLLSLFMSDKEKIIALLVLSSMFFIPAFFTMLPRYLSARKRLKSLLNQKYAEDNPIEQ